jgi:hypothetical protein
MSQRTNNEAHLRTINTFTKILKLSKINLIQHSFKVNVKK